MVTKKQQTFKLNFLKRTSRNETIFPKTAAKGTVGSSPALNLKNFKALAKSWGSSEKQQKVVMETLPTNRSLNQIETTTTTTKAS